MENQARMIKSSDGNKLAIVNPNAAGIDIADAEMQVCVPEIGTVTTIVDLEVSPKI